MKRGRPAQILHALVQVDQVDEQAQRILGLTGSLGVRHAPVKRVIRTRSFEEIEIDGQRIAVKVARDEAGEVRRAEPEFRDVARAAETPGRSQREVLEQAKAAVRDLLGLRPGRVPHQDQPRLRSQLVTDLHSLSADGVQICHQTR